MSDIVNWEYLAKSIGQFRKKSEVENLLPSEHLDLYQMIQHEHQKSQESETGGQDTQSVQVGSPIDDSISSDVAYIEVTNMKGRIKKINPNDFEVMIEAQDNPPLTIVLSSIAGGMYSDILRTHGAKEALSCIIQDYKQQPAIFTKPKLSFIQAKMIISSLVKTSGFLPEKSVDDILEQMGESDRVQMQQWLGKSPQK